MRIRRGDSRHFVLVTLLLFCGAPLEDDGPPDDGAPDAVLAAFERLAALNAAHAARIAEIRRAAAARPRVEDRVQ